MFLSSEDGYAGNLELPQECQGPFQGSRGISLETPQQKRASSRVERRISWFFSSCDRKLGVPLELRRGPQGSPLVASRKSSLHVSCDGSLRIPLQLVLGPKTLSRAEAGT